MTGARSTSDAGLMMDRARYLRDSGYERSARAAVRPAAPVHPPPGRRRALLRNAAAARRGRRRATASGDRPTISPGRSTTRCPPGADISLAALWRSRRIYLAGLARRDGRARPAQPAGRRGRDVRALCPRRPVAAGRDQGLLLGRARRAGRRARRPTPTPISSSAARYPELFYGQLALERLGRSVPAPRQRRRPVDADAQRAPFSSNRAGPGDARCSASRAAATSRPCSSGRSPNRSNNDAERLLALELGQQIGRQDLPVWVARAARNKGSAFYVRQAYPDAWLGAPPGRHVVAGPRHHPPGKLVRPHCGQPCRRARHDAADAGHRARAGGQDGRRL